MGILSKLARRPQAAAQQGSAAMTPMSSELIKWLSGHTSSGKAVNEKTMLGVSAAWCCRRILSESIGMLPWAIFKKEPNGNAEKADDYWLHDILALSPNRDQTSPEFRESKTMGLTGEGNAYSLIEKIGRRISSLTPIFGVKAHRKDGGNTNAPGISEGDVFFRFNDRGRPIDLPRDKVWQVKGWGPSLLEGLSPIMAAREALGGALAQEEFANRFFAQGGFPAGTVSYPGWLTKEQKVEAQEALQKMVGGLGNAHQIALFQGGMKPEPWNTMNLEEMQFIIARRFSVLEICRFYRVPPHMVAELEKGASYASIEQMSQEFVMFTLMPYLTRFEASVSKWLIPAEDRRRYFLRFNFEGLLRADSKGRAEMYASGVQNGWLNRNEVRAKENMNRVEGLDGFTAQTNLASVEKIVEGAVGKAVDKAFARILAAREMERVSP
ncbi:MAG: phage portal protein [Sulfuritalea sp.]|nr:phage portal protein [Sulfuritalea sp.]